MSVSLDLVRQRLALSDTQLGALFGVSRKVVFDWYESGVMCHADKARLEVLIEVLAALPETMALPRLTGVWQIPIDGQSFIAVFGDNYLTVDALHVALKEKLLALSPRLVQRDSVLRRSIAHSGVAHLVEFDRAVDYG